MTGGWHTRPRALVGQRTSIDIWKWKSNCHVDSILGFDGNFCRAPVWRRKTDRLVKSSIQRLQCACLILFYGKIGINQYGAWFYYLSKVWVGKAVFTPGVRIYAGAFVACIYKKITFYTSYFTFNPFFVFYRAYRRVYYFIP